MSIMKYTDARNASSYGLSPIGVSLAKIKCNAVSMVWKPIWEKNIETNSEYFKNGKWISELYEEYDGSVTSLVCGAGPSLYLEREGITYFHDMAKHSIKGAIYCVDSAYDTLLRFGVTPKLVISGDAQDKVVNFFKNITPAQKVALHINQSPVVVKFLIEKGADIYWCSCMNPFDGFFMEQRKKYGEHIATVRNNYVVTYAAVDIARWCYKEAGGMIGMVGNDLCFKDRINEEIAKLDYGNIEYVEAKIKCDDGKIKEKRMATISPFKDSVEAFEAFPLTFPDFRWIDFSNGLIQTWIRGSFYVNDPDGQNEHTTLEVKSMV